MPLDGPRQQLRLLGQLLLIVLAKVRLRLLVKGQDVIRRLQLRHGDEPDLDVALGRASGKSIGGWPYISALGGGGDPPADALQLGDQRLCSGGVYPHLRGCVGHYGSW